MELPADAVAPQVPHDPAEPVVEHAGLELEPDPEPDGLVVHPGEERQGVVAPGEAALEEVQFALRPENGVVQLHRLRQEPLVGDKNVGLGHVAGPPLSAATIIAEARRDAHLPPAAPASRLAAQ